VWGGVETHPAVGKGPEYSTRPVGSKSPQVGCDERGSGVCPQFHMLYGYY